MEHFITAVHTAASQAPRAPNGTVLVDEEDVDEEKKFTSEGVKKVLNGEQVVTESELSTDLRKDLTEMRVFLNTLLERL